jgi:hypothetical protein
MIEFCAYFCFNQSDRKYRGFLWKFSNLFKVAAATLSDCGWWAYCLSQSILLVKAGAIIDVVAPEIDDLIEIS